MGETSEKRQRLSGITVAVPETRELELFARMLQQEGASVLRCPLVSILDAPDPAPVLKWLQQLAAGEFQDLILLTGEGLRRLWSLAQREKIDTAVLAALKNVRKITRGPKPTKALKEIGLDSDLAAAVPTTAGVIETLRAHDLRGRSIGVQLYGEEPNVPLMEFLANNGARAHPVSPYIYAPAAHETQVVELIRKLHSGDVHVIAFTSASQVTRLVEVAEKQQLAKTLGEGLTRCKVAAIGPVVANALRDQQFRVDIMPTASYFLRPLLTEIASALKR